MNRGLNIPAVTVAVLGALFAAACSEGGGKIESNEEAPALAVEVAAVEARDMEAVVELTGTLEPRATVEVAARVGGRLDVLAPRIGDTVVRGEALGRLDDQEARQILAQAEAELAVARAQLAEARAAEAGAERALERTERLNRQGAASASNLDTARTEYEAQAARTRLAAARVEQQQAAVRSAAIRLSYTRITADWDDSEGARLVAARHVEPGTLVAANTPLLTLVDADPVIAVVRVNESDYGRIEPGQTVSIVTAAHPDRRFEGRVARLAPVFDEASRQARVEIEVPNPDLALSPGAFVEVRIVVGQRADVPTVPLDALVRRGGVDGVFVVEGETARFVSVEPGIEAAGRVEILGSPIDGPVVTLGQALLEDGGRVRPVEAGE